VLLDKASACFSVFSVISQVYSASYHVASGLLIVGFSSGIFGIYTMPECSLVHTLSISQHRIHTCAVNSSGEWLAFGSRTLGQLLVWEWQSESCKGPPTSPDCPRNVSNSAVC
jgi:WD40 repeat protein